MASVPHSPSPSIVRDGLPLKVPRLVQNLQHLPVEVVHCVFDDLPVSRVLSLTIHDIPYINACILSHLHYRKIFRTPDDLSLLRTYFALFANLRYQRLLPLHPIDGILAFPPSINAIELDDVRVYLHTSIVQHINSLAPTADYLNALSIVCEAPFSLVWDSSTLDRLQSRWIDLKTAARTLIALKMQQTERLHALVVSYPRILKSAFDISQEPRTKVPYIGRPFRTRRPGMKGRVAGRSTESYTHGVPVVPYDRYLRLFLKVLERYPLSDKDMPGISVPLIRARLGGFEGREVVEEGKEGREVKLIHTPKRPGVQKTQKGHNYTPEAVLNIQKATKGLGYTSPVEPSLHVHASPSSSDLTREEAKRKQIPRTKYTPYSVHPYNFASGYNQPQFEVLECENCVVLPTADIDWLEAFLWSCRYMEGMKDPWGVREEVTRSVGDMWKEKAV